MERVGEIERDEWKESEREMNGESGRDRER